MPFSLDRVVPWGRSFGEYERMFALTSDDLQGRILGCGDGPASFNAEATRRGANVVSVDPIYDFSRAEIRSRIDATLPEVTQQTRRNLSGFVWEEFSSVEALGRARLRAMVTFLNDFDEGRRSGRYVSAELPALPFEDRAFDLALCSHLLFLYSDHLSEEFHVRSAVELCRVAGEVRIFPLVGLDGRPSRHVMPVTRALEEHGWRVEVEQVAYEFQRGGNQMLRIV